MPQTTDRALTESEKVLALRAKIERLLPPEYLMGFIVAVGQEALDTGRTTQADRMTPADRRHWRKFFRAYATRHHIKL